MNFKHLLACAGCCAAFGLVACGDDSSSNTSGSMDDRVEHFTVISLDEQNQTIVTFEERKKDYCVVDPLTETASWKTVDRGNDTTTVKYEFITIPESELSYIRDSLNISVNGNTAVNVKKVHTYTEYGTEYKQESSLGYFVGGSPSSIKGTWVSIPCSDYGDGLECYISRNEGWHQLSLNLSDKSITLTEKYIPGKYDEEYDYDYDYDDYDYYTDDVTKSGLMYSVLKVLSGMRDYIYSDEQLVENYSEDIEELQAELGVVVKSKSKNAETFVLNDKTYNLSASKMVIDLDYMDHFDMNVTISADGKSCNFYQEYVDEVDRSTCKADLKDYMYGTNNIYDINDVTVAKAVSYYHRDNSIEFETCLMGFIGENLVEPDYDDDDWLDDEDDWLTDDESDYGDEGSFVLYKKSSSNKPSAKQFWRDYNHNMKELRKIFQ